MLNFRFEPLPYYSSQDKSWHPSVKIFCNNDFYDWQVFIIGFDDAKYTVPYANQFAKELAAIYKQAFTSGVINYAK